MTSVQMFGLLPARLDLAVMQGDGLAFVVGFYDGDDQPIDVSGWVAQAQSRRTPGGLLLAQFDLTVGGGSLDSHEIQGELPAAVTWTIAGGSWPWDMVLKEGWPLPRTVLAGQLTILPRATEVS